MAADKARYYLEKAVPELKEYEQKGIFNKVKPLSHRQTLLC
jgi:U3 small nucleolar RNA-associated protein 6